MIWKASSRAENLEWELPTLMKFFVRFEMMISDFEKRKQRKKSFEAVKGTFGLRIFWDSCRKLLLWRIVFPRPLFRSFQTTADFNGIKTLINGEEKNATDHQTSTKAHLSTKLFNPFRCLHKEWRKLGGRYSSVVSSAPTICGPGFESQAHHQCFFQFVLKL